jgi:hypothetical protein
MHIVDTHCHAGINWFEPVEMLLHQMNMNGVQSAVLIQHGGNYDNQYLLECVTPRRSMLRPRWKGWPRKTGWLACAFAPPIARRGRIHWPSDGRLANWACRLAASPSTLTTPPPRSSARWWRICPAARSSWNTLPGYTSPTVPNRLRRHSLPTAPPSPLRPTPTRISSFADWGSSASGHPGFSRILDLQTCHLWSRWPTKLSVPAG